jgi:hypothetical protein
MNAEQLENTAFVFLGIFIGIVIQGLVSYFND